MTAALDTAINGGLLELSSDEERRLKEYERTYTSDASTVEVRIQIPHVRVEGGREDVPISTRLVLERGLGTADALADVPAVVAARDIARMLQQFERRGKEQGS